MCNKEEIFQKYLTIWEKLYQKYNYVFLDYQDFCDFINNYLTKTNLVKENDIYKESQKFIIKYIHKNLKNNKITILLNYITLNINISGNPIEEINKIINWLRMIDYIPTTDMIIELLDKSDKFKFLIAKISKENLNLIKKNKDEILLLFLEIYCALNDIDIVNEQESLPILEDNTYETNDLDINSSIRGYMPTGVNAILTEIKSMTLKVLTKEEEQNLMLKIKNGNEEAYQYFIEHNLRLVISISKKFTNKAVPFEDLIQEGCIGLMKAIENFELEKGYKFSTYATCYIKQSILQALVNYGRTIKIPYHKSNDLFKYYKEIMVLEREYGHELSDREIASCLNISIEEVQKNNNLLKSCLSLNQKISDDDESELGDFISDNTDIENDFFISNLSTEMKVLFQKAGLSAKEIFILKYRWGLDNVEEKTLVELGNYFGVTKENIHIIENKAIKKLRKCHLIRNFIYYLDNPDKGLENLNNGGYRQSIHKHYKYSENKKNSTNNFKRNKKSIYSLNFDGKSYSKEEMDIAIKMLDDLDQEILQLFYDINIVPNTINSADLNKYRDILYERVIPNIAKNLESINAKKLSRK